jgi:LmbE family N-acetylglucosaminyl deacetylase
MGMTATARRAEGSDTHRRVAALGRVLGIWAHPDDETYLSGGLLAAATDNAQPTACVTATAGEHGTDDPRRWPPARLASLRRRELHRALAVVGVRDHRWLGYRDGTCAAVDPDRGAAQVLAHVRRFRPDTIVTFGSDGITGHPDHIAVGSWAVAAADAYGAADILFTAKSGGWIDEFADLHAGATVFAPGFPVATAPVAEAFGRERWLEWVRRESFR